MNPTPAQVQAYCEANVLPILKRWGATVRRTAYDAHLKAQPYERFIVMEIAKDGHVVELSGSEVENLRALDFMLEHWADLLAIAADMSNIAAPFHSDIHFRMHNRWPNRNVNDTGLAYMFVCLVLRKMGKTITSD